MRILEVRMKALSYVIFLMKVLPKKLTLGKCKLRNLYLIITLFLCNLRCTQVSLTLIYRYLTTPYLKFPYIAVRLLLLIIFKCVMATVSQHVRRKIRLLFFFLNTHCEMGPQQAFDYTSQLFMEYWKVIKNATNTLWRNKK